MILQLQFQSGTQVLHTNTGNTTQVMSISVSTDSMIRNGHIIRNGNIIT